MSTPPGPTPLRFGSALRRLRGRLSQKDLALRAETFKSTISRLESGERGCSWELAERLADALDLTDKERRLLVKLAVEDEERRKLSRSKKGPAAGDNAEGATEALKTAGAGYAVLVAADALEDSTGLSARSRDAKPYQSPRLRNDVIERLVTRYQQPQFFEDVHAMGGDILTEGQNVYPVVYFPAPAGQAPASVLPPTNLDAREGAPIRPEDVAVLNPRPRLNRWIAGHPGASDAEADRNTRDGWNICFSEVARADQGLTLTARLAPYGLILDSCDCLIDEAFADPGAGEWPLRDSIDLAAGNPLTRGFGRAAGVGIAAVMVCIDQDPDGTRRLDALVGRRSKSVGTYPDTWHVVPAGMFNWRFGPTDPNGRESRPWGSYEADDLLRSVLTEYAEETHDYRALETNRDRRVLESVDVVQELVRVARIEVTGIAIDLANLRPEVCVLVFIEDPGWAARQPWKLNYEYTGHGQPTAREAKEQSAEFTVITVAVEGEELNASALRRLDPEETVAAGAAAFWLGVRRARQLFAQSLVAD